ncbi:uncharacterized protein EV422DRAFT_597359 [Fimicolochytrium jonesii]|uniref:uncharacterized protein n=1 Tax=Fimicolochytrium jonesii TaxID=1396493 RepID=UPI0022FF32C6|nr:uncharacterized protein EV422DRAFT_597359 [Fimicolochytrium jonesii]KAI8820262.1 hypothetical protein EV422DRAFT_597359 [Fimicolochytrium jonesii]
MSDEDTPHHANADEPLPDTPLTAGLIQPSISLLARTGDGLSHAYTRLSLPSHSLTDIAILKNYTNLRYVDLSMNAIADLSPLANLEFLLSLDAHGNRVEVVGRELGGRKWLQWVDLRNNGIRNWEAGDWPMCGWLTLDDNALTTLSLPTFPSLLHLSLTRNTLERLHPLGAPKLQKLYLSHNPLGAVAGVDLDDKPALQVLHLRECGLGSLEGIGGREGAGLDGLVYLNLRGNNLSSTAEIDRLAHMHSLRILVLTDNPLTSHPTYRLEILARLPKLERLDKEPIGDDEREEAGAYKIQMVAKRGGEDGEGGEEAEADAEGESDGQGEEPQDDD